MISRLFFSPQAQLYKHDGAVQPVCHSQPCQPRHESSTLSILVNPMSRWCYSPDAQAAEDEIKTEIVRQGWHLLSKSSAKANMAIARDQKRDFVSYLALTYPTAAKDAPSWLQFIKTTMGCLKEWNSVSSTYWLCRATDITAALDKKRAGRGLSPNSCTKQGFDLSDRDKKLLERSVTDR